MRNEEERAADLHVADAMTAVTRVARNAGWSLASVEYVAEVDGIPGVWVTAYLAVGPHVALSAALTATGMRHRWLIIRGREPGAREE